MRIFLPNGRVPNRLIRWLIPVFLGLCLLFIAGCDLGNSNTLNPQGPVALQESDLFWFILIVATVVFVLVESALIYSVIRFRARPDSPEPRQIHGNTTLEIWWTIVPSLILFLVLGLTIKTLVGIQEPANTGQTIEVKVSGHQWWWEFQYEQIPQYSANYVDANGKATTQPMTTADDLVVPVGATVHLDLYSDNVIHSFWIPQLTGKTDVVPGHANHMWFKADTPGTYQGACAEFCGDQHAHMRFHVIVLSQADFAKWVANQQRPACDPQAVGPQPQCNTADLNSASVLRGKELFFTGVFANNNACIACHSIYGTSYSANGTTLTAQGVIGPNLTHFGSRDLIAGGVLDNNPAALAQWLTDPQSVKPDSDMPDLGLTPSQVQDLVAYLESLQ